MNSEELLRVLKTDRFTSRYNCYVLPLNHFLETTFSEPSLVIFNYDDCYQTGSHWVAVLINDTDVEYFDSYAIPPFHHSLTQKISRPSLNKIFKCNSYTFQGLSSVCGQYCLIYLLLRSRGYQMKSICKTLLYCKFSTERDAIVNDFINHHFFTLFNNPLMVYKKI